MTLEEFKKLHHKFSKLPLPKEVWDTPEHEKYLDLLHENKEYYGWTLIEKFDLNDFEYEQYCCLDMADKIFDSIKKDGEIKYGNMDIVMHKWKDGTYGIPIHDGGSSIIEIKFCPRCGTKLTKASS